MTPTLVERLRALLGFGDRRMRSVLGIGRRHGALLMRCAGCGSDLGILEPKVGVGACGFCSWNCIEATLRLECGHSVKDVVTGHVLECGKVKKLPDPGVRA